MCWTVLVWLASLISIQNAVLNFSKYSCSVVQGSLPFLWNSQGIDCTKPANVRVAIIIHQARCLRKICNWSPNLNILDPSHNTDVYFQSYLRIMACNYLQTTIDYFKNKYRSITWESPLFLLFKNVLLSCSWNNDVLCLEDDKPFIKKYGGF